jgi:hypothetical protein
MELAQCSKEAWLRFATVAFVGSAALRQARNLRVGKFHGLHVAVDVCMLEVRIAVAAV